MMNLILDPMILPLFASAMPEKDLAFSVEGCGTFRWLAHSLHIEKVSKDAHGPILNGRQLTQMDFDRSWMPLEGEAVLSSMAALFTRKTVNFNNEYF